MVGRDIIVIGFSAGGLDALVAIVRALPGDLPAAVFAVHHFPSTGTSELPNILSRAGTLKAATAEDGEPIRHGRIYLAASDQHLIIHRDYVVVGRGPRENGHRPAVDPLFRTAAVAYGPRVVGVVLSGALDDGTAGLTMVKQHGGIAIVQDPTEAMYPGMIRSAMEFVNIDHVVPSHQIPALLVRLATESVQEEPVMARNALSRPLPDPAEEPQSLREEAPEGTLTPVTCPECGGALWEHLVNGVSRWACHVGHSYSDQTIAEQHARVLDIALWTALRTLEEGAALQRRLADRTRKRGNHRLSERFARQAHTLECRADVIRGQLSEAVCPSPSEDLASGDSKL